MGRIIDQRRLAALASVARTCSDTGTPAVVASVAGAVSDSTRCVLQVNEMVDGTPPVALTVTG